MTGLGASQRFVVPSASPRCDERWMPTGLHGAGYRYFRIVPAGRELTIVLTTRDDVLTLALEKPGASWVRTWHGLPLWLQVALYSWPFPETVPPIAGTVRDWRSSGEEGRAPTRSFHVVPASGRPCFQLTLDGLRGRLSLWSETKTLSIGELDLPTWVATASVPSRQAGPRRVSGTNDHACHRSNQDQQSLRGPVLFTHAPLPPDVSR